MAARSLTSKLEPHRRIILAYDKATFDREVDWIPLRLLMAHVGMTKAGMQAMATRLPGGTSVALQLFEAVEQAGGSVMHDGKYKDILNTVAEAIKSLVAWPKPPKIATIHATMRQKSINAAVEAAKDSSMLVTGVTFLTDHDADDAEYIYNDTPENVVFGCATRLEAASQKFGVPVGIVCAPKELSLIKGFDLVKITPNIRDKDAPADDQERARSMTAAEAIKAGADYLVIGRPIMKAPEPVVAAQAIARQIESAL